ncbi:MAG TPA: hypothetical protein VED01_22370 [Burkholderiales bacterium]|nr:hypothetical protein [Burkholderiales bacterium]
MNRCVRTTTVAVVSLFFLSGCATGPAPRWNLPQPNEVPNQSMDYAKAYAHNARRAYQQAIDRELKTSTNVGTALIVLGGTIAALATFGAHKDTLLGGALLGGTAYAVTNWNSAKARLPHYQAGIEGINCALRVVSPLDMRDSDLNALKAALADIESATPNVQLAMNRTKALLQTLAEKGLNQEAIDAANAALGTAEQSLQAAGLALTSGRQLAYKVHRAGPELINAVDRIDAAVQKAGMETFPDLSAVKSVIAGLGSFAGDFAPGAGFTETIAQAFARHGPDAKAQSLPGLAPVSKNEIEALQREVNTLNNHVRTLMIAVNRVRSHVNAYDAAATTDALKDCGTGEVSTPLRASAEVLVFSGAKDQRHVVSISGGKKQYAATVEPAEGITIVGPMPEGSTVQVIANKALSRDARFMLTVTDSSQPTRKELKIPILVSPAAPAPAAPENKNGNAPSAAPTLDSLAFELNNLKNFAVPETKVTVDARAAVDAKKQQVNVAVTCKPANAQLSVDALRDALLRATEAGKALEAKSGGITDKVVLTSTQKSCLKPSK